MVTQKVVTSLAILAIFAGCASTPPADADGGTDPADARMPGDAPSSDDATVDPDGGPPLATWARRTCSATLRFAPRPGASVVQLAGDFTGWGDAPIVMSDADGDGVFVVTVGPENGLVPGQLHAYRVVVDGTYQLDPAATERKYDGGCINSGLRAPACTAGPEIVPLGELTTALTETLEGDTWSAHVRVAIRTAVDGAIPTDITFTLDGAPLDARSAVLDPARGEYDVTMSGLAIGRHVLAIRATDAMDRDAAPIDLPFWIEEAPFEWRDATMYMIVVDRFANGDPASDAPVGVERPADFHGGDLDGILEVMRTGYFEQMGVNALWLSPINQQTSDSFGGRDDGHAYAGYHGYWPTRGRAVEPRFGGDDALRALIDEAHARGIRVLLDLINNQIHEQHEYFAAHPDWFRTGGVCGVDPGWGWSERPLDCLFAPYLPDIDWRNPGAEAQFIADASFWIEEYGIDGFRIDAVKHVESSSITNLRAAIARRFEQAGYRHYFVGETAVGQWDSVDYGCGESYPNGYAWLDAYTGENALDGQFDFPSHHRLAGLVDGTMGFDAVEAVIADSQRLLRPEGLHVQFLGTHDSARIASRAAMDSRAGCRWVEGGCTSLPAIATDPVVYARLRRAIAVLYTMPGIPFLYYGDELAMAGGNDPDNRRDMMWEGTLAGVSMTSETPGAQQLALRDFVRALGRARAENVALRRGRRIPLVVEGDVYVVAWAGERPGELAILVANRGGAITGRTLDALTSGQLEGVTSFDAVAGAGSVRRGSGSRLLFDVPAGEVGLFVAR